MKDEGWGEEVKEEEEEEDMVNVGEDWLSSLRTNVNALIWAVGDDIRL